MPQRLSPLPRDVRYAELGESIGGLLGGLARRREEERREAKQREELQLQQERRQQDLIEEGIPSFLLNDPDGIKQWRRQKSEESKEQRSFAIKQKELGIARDVERQEREVAYNQMVNQFGVHPEKAARIRDLPKEQFKIEYASLVNSYIPGFARAIGTGAWRTGAAQPSGVAEQEQMQQTQPTYQTEGLPAEALRQATGYGVSGATGLAGVPGNILALAQSLGQQLPWQKQAVPTAEELERMPEFIRERFAPGKEQQQGLLPIPTTENLRAGAEKVLPEGYITPQSEPEQFLQEVATDIGSLMFPLPGASAATGTKLLKAGATSGFGNLTKLASKNLGHSPVTQEIVKGGATLLTSFGLEGMVKDRANQMQQAVESLGEGKTVTTKPLRSVMRKAQDFIVKGAAEAPDRVEVQKAVSAIGKVIDADNVALNTVVELKRDLGTFAQAAKTSRARKIITEASKGFDNFLKTSNQVPKEYSKLYSDANKVYSAVKEGDRINKTIKDTLKRYRGLGPVSAIMYPARAAKAAVVGGIGSGSWRTANFLKTMATNAPFRKEYLKLVHAGMLNKTPVIARQGFKIAKELEKQKI